MKLSLVSLAVLLSAGIVAAAPNPAPNAAPDANPGGWGDWGHQDDGNNCPKCPVCPKPPKNHKKPPPPAPTNVTVIEIVQICGNANAPHCCNSFTQSGDRTLTYGDTSISATCSAINGECLILQLFVLHSIASDPYLVGNTDGNAKVHDLCSTTVACCIGNNCQAVARK